MEAEPLAGQKRKKPEGVNLLDLPICEPEAGAFSLSSLQEDGNLVRLRVKGQSAAWLGARFRTERTVDFLAGEKVTAGTNTPPKVRVARSGAGGRTLEGTLYSCQRGVQRRPRRRRASAQPSEQDPKRRRGGALVHGNNGTVLKLDCPFCFTLQPQLDGTTVARIKQEVFQTGHVGHYNTEPRRFYESWVTDAIRAEYQRDKRVKASVILRELVKTAEAMECMALGLATFADVLVAYGQGGVVPSRSAFLNLKHVQSVLRRVRTEQSLYVEDPGAALEAWAEANRRDVFFFSGGKGGPTEKVCQAPVSRLQH
jgi:hypothetical protein